MFPALPVKPCEKTFIISHTSYISSQQSTQGSCQPSANYGGTQFYFSSKAGQRIKVSVLSLTSSSGDNSSRQVGHVVDEGEDEAFAIEVSVRRTDVVPLMVSRSSDVMVTIYGGEEVQYLVFVQGKLIVNIIMIIKE